MPDEPAAIPLDDVLRAASNLMSVRLTEDSASSRRKLTCLTRHLAICLALGICAVAQHAFAGVADTYLERYLAMFPTRATQAGNHSFDQRLEDFSTEKLQEWVHFNEAERTRLTKLLGTPDLSFDDRLDAEALIA